jgi:hypothetical protein
MAPVEGAADDGFYESVVGGGLQLMGHAGYGRERGISQKFAAIGQLFVLRIDFPRVDLRQSHSLLLSPFSLR